MGIGPKVNSSSRSVGFGAEDEPYDFERHNYPATDFC